MNVKEMPSDDWLLSLLRNGEDHIAERKTKHDKEGWVRTVTAFANSMPVGQPAVLFIGVDNKGRIPDNSDTDFDIFQRDTVLPELKRIYPRPYLIPRTLTNDDGRQCLALIVYGSDSSMRPHFSGPAFVRNGSRTEESSTQQFQALIGERSSKVYELRQWIGKTIACATTVFPSGTAGYRIQDAGDCRVLNCGQFYLTLKHRCGDPPQEHVGSLPLSAFEVSFDNPRSMLRLIIQIDHWYDFHGLSRTRNSVSQAEGKG